jgi:molecular chaperone GrpE (heat shock protein)
LTCYYRHMKDVFERAGITVTSENRKEIDRVIHAIVGVEYKDCSYTWGAVKMRLEENEMAYIATLKAALNS